MDCSKALLAKRNVRRVLFPVGLTAKRQPLDVRVTSQSRRIIVKSTITGEPRGRQ